ncbi:hypothetical protein [Roseimicrobium gellanilyticum]|uniref:hypothetical protein n=1 Tax=Roseimicrobium gellanilyticum TaxID=748857 RepID=UPI001B882097|nr:hypothetical protein [Roseimicrobium gellanilyticum]
MSRWSVPRKMLGELPQFLAGAGLNERFIKSLLDPARMTLTDEVAYLFPSEKDLEEMTSESRSAVYSMLGKHPGNEFHQYPIFFLTPTVAKWAEGTGLPDHIVEALRHYAYNRGGTLAFSDAPVLMRLSRSESEARLVARKLTRIQTVFARLEVDSTTDIPTVLNYWSMGLGLRRKELEPLLMAVTNTQGINHLDLLHLLPPLSRKFLYSYPGSDLAMMGRLPDCHWATLNFFNASAEQHYLDERLATTAILENFDRVNPPYRFGDVLMFVTPDEYARHSCNYVADDLVYTKNGSSLMQPFMLMHLSDLSRLYEVESGKLRIVAFRHKNATSGE